jgi:hypothetical protein
MRVNAGNITAAVAVVMMLIAAATGIYQLGRLSNQVENLSVQIEELRAEMHRGNQQLLYSLANHTHDADGNAVFTVPPGMEPTGANPNQPAPAQ